MRTSLNEIVAIEQHLMQTDEAGDTLLLEAKALIDPELQHNISYQRQAYHLVNIYGRRQLKNELEKVHQKLFTQPVYHTFAQSIRKLFVR